MGSTLTFKLDPSPRKIARALRAAGQDFGDWKPAFYAMLPILSEGLAKNVKAEGRRTGDSWAPLKPSYANRKARGKVGGRVRVKHRKQTLMLRGRLMATLSSPKRAKRSLTKTRLSVGPNKRYHFVLHHGSKKRGIAARPYVKWSPGMRNAAITIMAEHSSRIIAEMSDAFRSA